MTPFCHVMDSTRLVVFMNKVDLVDDDELIELVELIESSGSVI